jgi:Flp pilus assembly pilin Flp
MKPQLETLEPAMKSTGKWFRFFWHEEGGNIPIEYAVAIALIAIAIFFGLTSLGSSVSNQNNATSNMLNGGPIPSSS